MRRTILGEVALNKIVALPCCDYHAKACLPPAGGGRRLGIRFPDGRTVEISPCNRKG